MGLELLKVKTLQTVELVLHVALARLSSCPYTTKKVRLEIWFCHVNVGYLWGSSGEISEILEWTLFYESC